MYSLYDPDFTLEYTEADEVIIYHKGKEIAQEVIPGLTGERQLMDVAISILAKMYPEHEYIAIPECARMLNLNRGSIDWIVNHQLILNYHYIAIGGRNFLTAKGVEAIEKKLKEKND